MHSFCTIANEPALVDFEALLINFLSHVSNAVSKLAALAQALMILGSPTAASFLQGFGHCYQGLVGLHAANHGGCATEHHKGSLDLEAEIFFHLSLLRIAVLYPIFGSFLQHRQLRCSSSSKS